MSVDKGHVVIKSYDPGTTADGKWASGQSMMTTQKSMMSAPMQRDASGNQNTTPGKRPRSARDVP